MRSRSHSSNFVFALHWCSCVPYLVRIHQIFLQILSGNHLSYVVTLNDLCDLENEVKVTQFKLGLSIALVLMCTIFGEDTSNISKDIEWKPSFICCTLNDLCDPENEDKVTQIELGLRLALVLMCTKIGKDRSNISSRY